MSEFTHLILKSFKLSDRAEQVLTILFSCFHLCYHISKANFSFFFLLEFGISGNYFIFNILADPVHIYFHQEMSLRFNLLLFIILED